MIPKMLPKSSQNRVGIRIGFALCFSLFLAPQMEPTTLGNSNITYIKQRFSQIVPFPFDHRFGTKKSPKTTPKPLQNPSKKHPENTSKINTKFHGFWAQKGLPNDARNPPKSTRGALWAQMGPRWDPKRLKREVQPPRGPQNGRPGTLRGTIFITFGTKFGCFSISFTTSFRLCRTMFASISNDKNIKIRRRRRDKPTNKRMNEQANEITNKRTNKRKIRRTIKQTSTRTN